MNWRKLGKIFDPAAHQLPSGCKLFAQSPQALVFDSFVRIYFSTRAIDTRNNKFLSHVAYVEMSKDLRKVLRVSTEPVLPLGGLGAFDEHGIFPFSPIRHEGKIWAYTCGWSRRVSVSVETGIGLAFSQNEGKTFERLGTGPVMSSSLTEPYLVGDAFVIVSAGIFHMWYIYGTGWRRLSPGTTPERTYKIGHATSEDGIRWRKDGDGQIIADQLGPDESQALPTVVKIDDLYHMFFCYRESFDFRNANGRGYRIGHAWSADLKAWVRDDQQMPFMASVGDWDSEMQCYPHAFKMDGQVYLLYNGNEFGRYGFGAAVLE